MKIYLQKIFKGLGYNYRVKGFSDPNKFLRHLHESSLNNTTDQPVLCLMDYKLKGGDCRELVSHVKRRYPESKIILSTGYPDYSAFSDIPYDYILEKPYGRDNLQNIINDVLKKAGIQQESN